MEDKKTILMIANSGTGANGFLSFVERLKDRNDIRFVMVCHPRVQIRTVREKAGTLALRLSRFWTLTRRRDSGAGFRLTGITNMSKISFMFRCARRFPIRLRLSRRTGRDFAGQKA